MSFQEYLDQFQRVLTDALATGEARDANKVLLFRYDNATHRPLLSQQEHKHTSDGVMPSSAPTIRAVLDEIGV